MRALKAIASGLVVGVILIEAALAGLAVLLPPSVLMSSSDYPAEPLAWPLLPVPALVWLVGGAAAGAMAAAMNKSAWTGVLAGLVLAVPAALVVGLVEPGDSGILLAGCLPLAGAAAGSALAARLEE
ncbi:MAG TPA: hypothetical protein VK036_06550 [Wenzhouxiangella sp.]|nr:hypothetical protein [Wenzhouxiangella sp.]